MNKVDYNHWVDCQKFEKDSWGSVNIFLGPENTEQKKQNQYAEDLGLVSNGVFPIDLKGKSVIDVGCGPISLLLRSTNFSKAVGVEPLFYDERVDKAYRDNGINLIRIPAEEINTDDIGYFDEVWMYNCLQHVMSPSEIIDKLVKIGKKVRIFEWINIKAHEGHPHELTESFFVEKLNLKPEDYKIVEYSSNFLYGKAIVINKDI